MAKQLNLDRQVALKIMAAEFIKSLDGDEEEITSEIMRFRRKDKMAVVESAMPVDEALIQTTITDAGFSVTGFAGH